MSSLYPSNFPDPNDEQYWEVEEFNITQYVRELKEYWSETRKEIKAAFENNWPATSDYSAAMAYAESVERNIEWLLI